MRPGSFASDRRRRIFSASSRRPRRISRRARWSAARPEGPTRPASTRRNSTAAASASFSFSRTAPRLKRTRAKNAAVPGASSFLRAGGRGCGGLGVEDRAERGGGLGETPSRGPHATEVEPRAPAGGRVAAGLRAPVPLGEEALGEIQVALGLRGLDEEREEPVRDVPGRAAAHLAREDDRRRVVAARLAQEVLAERLGRGEVAGLLEALGPQRDEPAPLARRRGRTGGDELLERGRVEARLERVQRDAQRPPRDGAALPLQEREQELERAEAVARLEAQRARGEARRHVEEVVGRHVPLEDRDRGALAARGRERPGVEVVEAAVLVAERRLAPQGVEPLEDLVPAAGARRGRERLLAPGLRPAERRRREERREGGGAEERANRPQRGSGGEGGVNPAARRTAARP